MTLTVNQQIDKNPHLHHLLMTKPDNTLQIVSDQLKMTSFDEPYNFGAGFSPVRNKVTAEMEEFFENFNLAKDTPMLNVLSHLYKRDVPCVSVFNADDRDWALKSLLAAFVDKRLRIGRKNVWTVFLGLFPEDIEYIHKALTADHGLRDAVIKRIDDVDLLDEQCLEIVKDCPKDDKVNILISTFSLFTDALNQPYFGIGLFDSIGIYIYVPVTVENVVKMSPVLANERQCFKKLFRLAQEMSQNMTMGILYKESPIEADEILDLDHPYHKLPKFHLGTQVGYAADLNHSITHDIRNDLPTGKDILELLPSFPGKSVIYCEYLEMCEELYEEVLRLQPKRREGSNQIKMLTHRIDKQTQDQMEEDFRSGGVRTIFTTKSLLLFSEKPSFGLHLCIEFSYCIESYVYPLTCLEPDGHAVLFARPKWLKEQADIVKKIHKMFP